MSWHARILAAINGTPQTSAVLPVPADRPAPDVEGRHPISPSGAGHPTDREPPLSDVELVAVRQLIEERFPFAALIAADQRVANMLSDTVFAQQQFIQDRDPCGPYHLPTEYFDR